MNRFIILLILLLCLSGYGQEKDYKRLVIEGNYKGKNLFVQNPYSTTGVGFCAFEVIVNGVDVTTDEINASMFQVDFASQELEPGESVIVEIKHKKGCRPKFINPETMIPKSTFEVVSMEVDDEDILHWTTKNESGKLPYVIEQYRWNKWIELGEVNGTGEPGENSYKFKIIEHTGENKFRVKQTGHTMKPRYSKPITFKSDKDKVKCDCRKVGDQITFSTETMYEIFDMNGKNVIKRGYGDTIDVSDLKKGEYHIQYDNVIDTFKKK